MDAQQIIEIIQTSGWHTAEPWELAASKSALKPGESPRVGDGEVQIYLRSLQHTGSLLAGMVRDAAEKRFFVFSSSPQDLAFAGEVVSEEPWLFLAPRTIENASVLHDLFPFTKPASLKERPATFGMGDRLGNASAGHLRAARAYRIAPVLAQQSVRENDFTGRSFPEVVADATWLVFQEGFEDGYGADGDHLKNIPAIDTALAAGMPMITLDLTEVMRPEPAGWSPAEVEKGFSALAPALRKRILETYGGKTFTLGPDVTITIQELEAKRCTLMYGPALDFSSVVNDRLHRHTGGAYDLEISIDETSTPTLPEHHLFIARELAFRGVEVNSLAPRFIGEFQKGVDYIGDLKEFERQFSVHCLIARTSGSYKISVHSGSDKFSVYPVVGRETGGRLHLKTAGTSWLVALHTLAVHDPALYRKIHTEALATYRDALRFYVISADFAAIPPLSDVSDARLEDYLADTNSRQMLHICYGGILKNRSLKAELYAALHRLEEEYAVMLEAHLGKHMKLLGLE